MRLANARLKGMGRLVNKLNLHDSTGVFVFGVTFRVTVSCAWLLSFSTTLTSLSIKVGIPSIACKDIHISVERLVAYSSSKFRAPGVCDDGQEFCSSLDYAAFI